MTKQFDPAVPAVPAPSFTSRLDTYDVERLHSRFWSLVDVKHVRYRSQRCYAVYRSRPGAEFRILPEGICPLKSIGRKSHEAAMEQFFSVHASSGVAVWPEGYAHYGTFAGAYSDEFRSWIDANLVFGPVCLMSRSDDVALVADRDLRFSVVIASPEIIKDLDECFGGRDQLEKDFVNYVKCGDFGEGVDDFEWVVRELTS